MIVDLAKNVVAARRILADWVGKGGQPVPLEQAQARANICLKCPHNYQGSWLWNVSTSAAIATQMHLRRIMNLALNDEHRLKVCDVCGCQLRLKVHVPFIHIYRHSPETLFYKYPDFCWQKQELQQMPKP